MEKAMAPHSSTLAWKIPWSEEPGRLQSIGSLGIGHDWATSLSLFTFMHWRRKWQSTLVFLPGESQGRGNLVGCCLWGRTGSDATEATAAAANKEKRRLDGFTGEVHQTFEEKLVSFLLKLFQNNRAGNIPKLMRPILPWCQSQTKIV